MKFRTKIWMMPISAAMLFTIGVALSAGVGSQLSQQIRLLREVDEPYMAQIQRVNHATEAVQSVVQSASIEGDAEKLKDVEPNVKLGHDALTAIDALEGKQGSVKALSNAFDSYTTASVSAARAMLTKTEGDSTSKVQAMQAALGNLQSVHKKFAEEARAGIDARYDSATDGAARSIIVVVATGLVVLTMLGLASWVTVRSVWRELGDEPERLRDVVSRIAGGEIDVQLTAAEGDNHSINGALAGMTGGLRTMIVDIRQVADSIRTASAEIAAGNLNLSHRTEQTAGSLQHAASSMEQLTATVRQTAASASAANDLASTATQAAQRGGNVVSEVVANMNEIDRSSRKITEIIAVIDGIAFQTNILALNAAVEAARAGEQGRGFAVVAAEVRTLAQRSATAAKEIKGLILASSEKIDSGTRLVQDAGNTMSEVVKSVKHVNDIIGEIATASREQSGGIGTVTATVNQLDQMTQQNAALVEESAAAAESLSEQTVRLTDSVSRFRLESSEYV